MSIKQKDMYTAKEFAELIGVTTRTLRKWDKSGRFKARRTPSGRIFYTDSDYALFIGGEDDLYAEDDRSWFDEIVSPRLLAAKPVLDKFIESEWDGEYVSIDYLMELLHDTHLLPQSCGEMWFIHWLCTKNYLHISYPLCYAPSIGYVAGDNAINGFINTAKDVPYNKKFQFPKHIANEIVTKVYMDYANIFIGEEVEDSYNVKESPQCTESFE